MTSRIAITAAAGLLACTATSISAAQATTTPATPRLVTEAGAPRATTSALRRTPRQIVYSGDGSALIAGTGRISAHLRWTSWTASAGVGTGADWHDNCRPSCAQGTYHAYPVRIRAYRPRRVGGVELFTRITTTFTHASPPYPGYRHRSVTYRLQYRDRVFFWTIP